MAIKIKTTASLAANGVKLLCYGQSGAGKTSLIPTLPNPIILSAEGGLLSIKGADLPYIEVASMEDLKEAYLWLTESAEADGFQSVALDSISEIAEVVLSAEKKNSKDPRQAYGAKRARTRWGACSMHRQCLATRPDRRCRTFSTKCWRFE
jgi:hypothetical protein